MTANPSSARITVIGAAIPDTHPVDRVQRQMSDLLGDRTPPNLQWLRGARIVVIRDGGRWRQLDRLPAPPLVDRQVADLTWYRPVGGTRRGLPYLAVGRTAALIAEWADGDWWWLTCTDHAPISDMYVALAGVRYEIEADR